MKPAHITVWRIDVPAHEPHLESLRPLLSDDERARAARFLRRHDAVRSIVARGCLRLVLGRATGIAPRDLAFVYGANGKPALAPPATGVHFNLSHSGDVVLIAMSSDCDVLGVDVEEIRPLSDMAEMANHVLTARERAVYDSLDASKRTTAFFRAWTCKEALLKATGDGLGLGLDHFEVTLAPRDPAQVLAVGVDATAAGRWRVAMLDVRPGYTGAVGYRDAEAAVRVCDLVPDSSIRQEYVTSLFRARLP